ncbi:MAG: hypothetical protein ACYCYE_12060 [Clostridia bacterium]
MKKIIPLLLCLSLVLSMAQATFADNNYNSDNSTLTIGERTYKVLEKNDKSYVVQMEDGISVTQTNLAEAAGTTTSGTASEALLDAMNQYNTSYSYYGSTVKDNSSSEQAYLSDMSIYGYEQDEGSVYLVKTTPLSYYSGKIITHFISGDGYVGTEFNASTIYLVDPNYNSTYAGKRSASKSSLAQALGLTTWDYGDGTWRVNVIW